MANRYDKSYYYDRQPKNRRDEQKEVPSVLAVIAVVLAVFVPLGIIIRLYLTDGAVKRKAVEAIEPTPSPKTVAIEQSLDTVGETGEYVVTDQNTGIQYLVTVQHLITDKNGSGSDDESVVDEGVADVG